MQSRWRYLFESDHATAIDLSEVSLPLVEVEAEPGEKNDYKRVEAIIAEADSFVFVVPEWNGMAPPRLMNLFQLFTNDQFAHKPALPIGVSQTCGGAYPLCELRISAFKNTRISFIPEQIIIREVEEFLRRCTQNEEHHTLRQRIDYGLRVLHVYAQAYRQIQASELVFDQRFQYGM